MLRRFVAFAGLTVHFDLRFFLITQRTALSSERRCTLKGAIASLRSQSGAPPLPARLHDLPRSQIVELHRLWLAAISPSRSQQTPESLAECIGMTSLEYR